VIRPPSAQTAAAGALVALGVADVALMIYLYLKGRKNQ
jgi:hypothetical protein